MMRSSIACALSALLAGNVAIAAEPARTLRLVEHAATDSTAHVGPKSDNRGDILTFANDVFDAADRNKLGTDQGYCVRVMVGRAFECVWTLLLKDGQVTVEGPFYDSGDSVLAVTGGTGAYAGAGGEMHLHARDAKGSAYDFTYVFKR